MRGSRWLATGGSDGRVITFEFFDPPLPYSSPYSSTLPSSTPRSRNHSRHPTSSSGVRLLSKIAAHDSSVTHLQLSPRFLLTSGNDGRTRLFGTQTGNYVREMSEVCESVWKVGWREDTVVVMGRRAGKTVVEVWDYGARGGLE